MINLSLLLVSEFAMTESSAKMMAGKLIKKVTEEKAPEDGLVDYDVVEDAIKRISESKTSKFKEQATALLKRMQSGEEFDDALSVPNVKKEKGESSGKASKADAILKKVKAHAEEFGYDDILEIIEGK